MTRPWCVLTLRSSATPPSPPHSRRVRTSRSLCAWTTGSRPRSPRYPRTPAFPSSTPTPSTTSKSAGGSLVRRSPRSRSPHSPHRRTNHVPGRLVVRRVPDLNPAKAASQETLFDTWRFLGFFTTTDLAMANTVAADMTHRAHAVTEQVHADLGAPPACGGKNSALAHLPSGTLTRKRGLAGSWPSSRSTSPEQLRSSPCATGVPPWNTPKSEARQIRTPTTDHRPADGIARSTPCPSVDRG